MKFLILLAMICFGTACTTQVEVRADPNAKLVEANILLLRELKQTQESLIRVINENQLIAAENDELKAGKTLADVNPQKLESH